MQDDVIFKYQGKELTAALLLEIDHHTARKIREKIDEQLFSFKPQLLILDFSGVRFMDSSGIGLILGRAQTASSIGVSLQIKGLSPTLSKLMRISGVDKVENITICR